MTSCQCGWPGAGIHEPGCPAVTGIAWCDDCGATWPITEQHRCPLTIPKETPMNFDELLDAVQERIPDGYLIATGGQLHMRTLSVITRHAYPELSRDDVRVRVARIPDDHDGGNLKTIITVDADDFATAARMLLDLFDELTTQEPTS